MIRQLIGLPRQSPEPQPGAEPGPLHSAAFRRLVAAYTINQFGNWAGDVALAILVFDRTGSALATAALFLALRFIPALLGPLLTAKVEVIKVRRSLPAIYLAEGLIFAVIAWLAGHFSLTAVLILGALDGTLSIAATALTRAATAALLPSAELLRRGNAVLNVGFSAGGAAGPALAGLMVALLGPGSTLLVDGATFVTVAAILGSTAGLRVVHGDAASWHGRLQAGLSEAWSRTGVRRLLLAQALALIFFTAVVPIEVVYAKRTLHAGDAGYGAFLAAWGAGMVLGSIIYAAAARIRLLSVLVAGTALIGCSYAGIALTGTLAAACGCSVIGGIGNGMQWVAVLTALQQSLPKAAQSSVMALSGSIDQVMPAIGFLLGGLLATAGSPRTTYGVAAAGVFMVLLIVVAHPPEGLGRRDSEGRELRAPAEPV